ncbi:MAG: diguanylate cyclase [Butyrivibrio sp.]|nr:diguanylate cyclase [Butyrivibrio sp.]
MFFRLITIFIFFSMWFGAITTNAADYSSRQYRILFISSYGFSNAVVPEQLRGFEEGLGDLNYQIDYEFMDSEYYYRSTDIINFERYLSYKYYTQPNFDLIAIADDQALRFLNNHRADIFKDKPVVFMGVNNITEATTTSALNGVTGIAEVVEIEENYRLMKKLFPDRNNLVAIVDATIAGQGNFVEFMKFKDTHPELTTKVINTSYYTANGIKEALSDLGANDMILFLDFSIDGENNLYPLQNAAAFISAYTDDVPIFRVASAQIENGVLGGLSYSYYDAGELAGEMAKNILLGADPDSMPFITTSISKPYFEQAQMDKFGIKYTMLPDDVVIINEKPSIGSFYRENTVVSNLVILIAFLLINTIVILIKSNTRRYKMIRTDYLTGLPNRTYLAEKISKAIESGSSYGIIMMDVDYFKHINDTYGHQTGDDVLFTVASRLKEFSNKDITFARLAGDEFSAIISNPDKEKAIRTCSSIVSRMRDSISISNGKIDITVSLGCAIYPDDVKDIESVMECADQALYETKKQGRNGYSLFSGNNQST